MHVTPHVWNNKLHWLGMFQNNDKSNFILFFHELHNSLSSNELRNMKVPDMFYVEIQITNLPTVRYNRVVTQTYLDLVGKFITEID